MDDPQEETLLERAQRHVIEAEARVAHQMTVVAELARDGHDTTAAELLLSTMKETLLLMRSHLADEQAANNGNQQ
jgi:hypothetical protein